MSDLIMRLFRKLAGNIKPDKPPSGGYLYQDEDIGGVNIMYHTELETRPKRKLTQEQKDRYNKTRNEKRNRIKETDLERFNEIKRKRNEQDRNRRKRKKENQNKSE